MFEAEGHSYELRFTANALCRLEEKTGKGVVEMAALLGDSAKLRISDLRVLFWAGLDVDSLEEAGEVIDAIGFEKAGELIGQAFEAAFPAEEAGKTPPKGKRKGAGASTGRRS